MTAIYPSEGWLFNHRKLTKMLFTQRCFQCLTSVRSRHAVVKRCCSAVQGDVRVRFAPSPTGKVITQLWCTVIYQGVRVAVRIVHYTIKLQIFWLSKSKDRLVFLVLQVSYILEAFELLSTITSLQKSMEAHLCCDWRTQIRADWCLEPQSRSRTCWSGRVRNALEWL